MSVSVCIIQHGTVLIIFPLNLQTNIIAHMLSTGWEGSINKTNTEVNPFEKCSWQFSSTLQVLFVIFLLWFKVELIKLVI